MRKLSVLAALLVLLAPASTCGQQAQAKIPPDEIRVTVWDNRHRGMGASYKVYWREYLLTMMLLGDSRPVHLRMDDPVDPRVRHFFDLDVEGPVPPLNFGALPRAWREPIRVCTEMAAAALEKEANTKALPPEVMEVLQRIVERRFFVTGLPVQDKVSLSWRTDFLGEGPTTVINYDGVVSRVKIVSDPKKVSLELFEHPTFQDSSPCTMELTVREGRLNMKILNRGQGGPPSETRTMETVRREVAKVLGIVKLEGAEDDVLWVLEELKVALSLASGFDRFEVVTAESIPTR